MFLKKKNDSSNLKLDRKYYQLPFERDTINKYLAIVHTHFPSLTRIHF